ARIAWFARDEEETHRIKRKAIEAYLWCVHETRISDVWETVEREKLDKDGKPIIGPDGKPVMVRYQRAKFASELPDDIQRAIENYSVTEDGRIIPKLASKMEANRELRKFLGFDKAREADSEFARMSDAELWGRIRQLMTVVVLSGDAPNGDAA